MNFRASDEALSTSCLSWIDSVHPNRFHFRKNPRRFTCLFDNHFLPFVIFKEEGLVVLKVIKMFLMRNAVRCVS